MTEDLVSDAAIAALSPAERRDLIRRLQRPLADLVPTAAYERQRRIRLGLMISGAVGLIPWIGYLALTLPDTYLAHNWPATWVGFDLLLVLFMVATAVLGFRRRQVLILSAFTTGVLLVCDVFRRDDCRPARPVGVAADRGDFPSAGGDPDHRRAAHPAADRYPVLADGPGDSVVAAAVAAVTGTLSCAWRTTRPASPAMPSAPMTVCPGRVRGNAGRH